LLDIVEVLLLLFSAERTIVRELADGITGIAHGIVDEIDGEDVAKKGLRVSVVREILNKCPGSGFSHGSGWQVSLESGENSCGI
jgi:hypothetical protein